jgi:hypothetical protein
MNRFDKHFRITKDNFQIKVLDFDFQDQFELFLKLNLKRKEWIEYLLVEFHAQMKESNSRKGMI